MVLRWEQGCGCTPLLAPGLPSAHSPAAWDLCLRLVTNLSSRCYNTEFWKTKNLLILSSKQCKSKQELHCFFSTLHIWPSWHEAKRSVLPIGHPVSPPCPEATRHSRDGTMALTAEVRASPARGIIWSAVSAPVMAYSKQSCQSRCSYHWRRLQIF